MGAPGGSGNAFGVLLNNDGQGGIAVANVLVTAGESIDVFVGGNGHDGRLPVPEKGGALVVERQATLLLQTVLFYRQVKFKIVKLGVLLT